jgi:hypothetical protein
MVPAGQADGSNDSGKAPAKGHKAATQHTSSIVCAQAQQLPAQMFNSQHSATQASICSTRAVDRPLLSLCRTKHAGVKSSNKQKHRVAYNQLLTISAGADVCDIHVQHSTQAKVCNLAAEATCIAWSAFQQHIGTLQVTVHHSNGVQVVQARGSV